MKLVVMTVRKPSVRRGAWDRQGLERLARYCARPSFSEDRLDRLSDEMLAYRLRKPLADGRTCLCQVPLELLARSHDGLPLVCLRCG